jgi:hypothetical protein
VALQSVFSAVSARRPHGWGALALLAWGALALHVSGALPLDAINPQLLSGCAVRVLPLQSRQLPETITPGMTLAYRDRVEELEPGSSFVYQGKLFLLVGVDFEREVIVLEDPSAELVSVPMREGQFRVQRFARGGRVGLRVAGIVGGAIGGLLIGAGIGATQPNDFQNSAAVLGGCFGALAGAASGAAISIPLTLEKRFRLGEERWQVVPPRASESML